MDELNPFLAALRSLETQPPGSENPSTGSRTAALARPFGDKPCEKTESTAELAPARDIVAQDDTGQTAGATLGDIISVFGLADTDLRQKAENAASQVLHEHGLEAAVTSVRWGTITLTAPPAQSRMLRYALDDLSAAVTEATDGAVTTVRIRVSRKT